MIHIHNGDLVAELAKRSAVPGDHVAFREALATGPATRDVELRARFLADAHDENLLRVRNDLLEQERALAAAAEHGEVVLWFEHDLFCLANLIALLDQFREVANLRIVWSVEPLSGVELMPLFDASERVSSEMRDAGVRAWRAFSSADPRSLEPFLAGEVTTFPFLRPGLALHASRFPSTHNGLGGFEQRVLELVGSGIHDFPTLFSSIDAVPPRFGWGDAEVVRVLRSMAGQPVPLVAVAGEWRAPESLRVVVTETGMQVVSGEKNALALNPIDTWIGGVHLTPGNLWRWDPSRGKFLPPAAT